MGRHAEERMCGQLHYESAKVIAHWFLKESIEKQNNFRPLGDLTYLRIWHDNTGRGNYASWHCTAIVIRDIQTNEMFEFVVNRWFASEKDDGQIDRLIPSSGDAQKNEFKHLFNFTGEKSIRESHLWFSIFMRSERSRFTRCQRVSACMALLYLSMLADAMWYDTVPEEVTSGVAFGPVTLSPQQILVGLWCNIVTFPPAFLIIFFFRKARKRRLRPNRVNKALEQEQLEKNNQDVFAGATDDTATLQSEVISESEAPEDPAPDSGLGDYHSL